MKEVKCLSPLFVWMKMLDKGNDNFGIFNAKADEGIYLGYYNSNKAFRIFNK